LLLFSLLPKPYLQYSNSIVTVWILRAGTEYP
jgi:hypothetical protein